MNGRAVLQHSCFASRAYDRPVSEAIASDRQPGLVIPTESQPRLSVCAPSDRHACWNAVSMLADYLLITMCDWMTPPRVSGSLMVVSTVILPATTFITDVPLAMPENLLEQAPPLPLLVPTVVVPVGELAS